MTLSLVPDIADLSVLLCVCGVAVLCAGLGIWTGARRVETALIAGWGVAGLATVAAGTLTGLGLSNVMAALALGGGAGLVKIGIDASKGRVPPHSKMAARVALLALPLIACIASMQTIGWDDFGHWLPNLAYLCENDHFPTLALPGGSGHAAYPYGLALPGFAVFLVLGRVPDNAALFWNVIVMLAAGASIATLLAHRLAFYSPADRRSTNWACASIGLLLAGLACPSFVPKIFFSNMADPSTGAVLAVLGSMLFDWVDARDDRGRRISLAVVFAFGCIAFIDLRQANAALFGLLVLGCCLAGWRHRTAMGAGAGPSLAIAVLPPLIVLQLWGHYTATQIPGGQFEFLPFAVWRWSDFPTTLYNMLRVMVAKAGLFASILALTIRAALGFRTNDGLDQPDRFVIIAAATVCIGAIFFLAFTYLAAGFSREEALSAVSFWRYMGQTGPLAILGLAACVPLTWSRRVPPKAAAAAFVAIAVLLPVATVKFYRDDLASPVPMLRNIAREVDSTVPRSAPLELVDMTGNGFPVLVVYYELVLSGRDHGLPPRTVGQLSGVDGISAGAASKLDFHGAHYIWLAEGAPEMTGIFGPRLSAGCSYLLKREDKGFSVAASWPIGPFKWGSYRDGWSGVAGGRCV
jgi:hypothetical protein